MSTQTELMLEQSAVCNSPHSYDTRSTNDREFEALCKTSNKNCDGLYL